MANGTHAEMTLKHASESLCGPSGLEHCKIEPMARWTIAFFGRPGVRDDVLLRPFYIAVQDHMIHQHLEFHSGKE